MKVVLVDDESIALEVLSFALSSYDDIEIIGSYTDPHLALKDLDRLKPHVIFLDIEMGPVNGLEIAHRILGKDDSIEIVFITAYSQYAVGAFELNALDYLLKPIQKKRLDKTIKRLREKISVGESKSLTGGKLKIISFGAFEVLDREGKPLVWRTQKGKELFAYLWVNRKRPLPKSQLIENIFAHIDIDRATTLLHTTVYQVRKSLSKRGYSDGILFFNDNYQLNLPVTSDLEELKNIFNKSEHRDKDIVRILELYKGNFLENEAYPWSMGLEQLHKNMALDILIDYANQELLRDKQKRLLKMCLDLLYRIDPFNEDIVKMFIKYYGDRGEYHNLREFFGKYVEDLYNEMGLAPLRGTRRLYENYIK